MAFATDYAFAVARHLLLVVGILVPLELVLPARREQRLLRRGLATDLAFFAVGPLLVKALTVVGLAALAALVERAIPTSTRDWLASQPFGVQVVEILALSELGGYWAHRAAHAIPSLWRLHAVHHSSEELDWMAGHRQHPLEAAWFLLVANLPLLVLGFRPEALAGFIVFQKIYTAFVHANVRLSFGRLDVVLASPLFHRWHHAAHTAPTNFSSLFPIFDLLFGTYRAPRGEVPRALGVDEPMPRSFVALLLAPFRRRPEAP
jgi:sterol desaturase/sphingolipid hydroxylase (fatty acid hydroxylase superfamily)